MKTPEGYVKDDIDSFMERTFPRAYKFKPVQMGQGKRTVDRLYCINGRFVGVEVKREGKKPTKLQYDCLREIAEAGGIAFWCDSFESFMLNMAGHGLIAEPRKREVPGTLGPQKHRFMGG